MTTNVLNTLKHVMVFTFVFFTLISCEKEMESLGVNLVDNNNFSQSKITSEVNIENKNIENVPTSGVSQYLLGVYDNEGDVNKNL